MTIIPQCIDCKHLKLDGKPGAMACEAFPQGIPTPILMAKADHREPFEGDHGIRFEPIEAASKA